MTKNGFNMMEKFYFDRKSDKEPFFVAVYRFKGATYNPGKFKLLLEPNHQSDVPDELSSRNNFTLG
jgi:hypothetical protein